MGLWLRIEYPAIPSGCFLQCQRTLTTECCRHSSIPWAVGEHKGQTGRADAWDKEPRLSLQTWNAREMNFISKAHCTGLDKMFVEGRDTRAVQQRGREEEIPNPRSAVAVWCQHLPGNLHQLDKAGMELRHYKSTTNGQNHLPFHLEMIPHKKVILSIMLLILKKIQILDRKKGCKVKMSRTQWKRKNSYCQIFH